jgi:hypothetical protein
VARRGLYGRDGLGEGVGFPSNQRGGGDLPGVPAVFIPVSLAGMTGGALLSARQGEESVTVRRERGNGPWAASLARLVWFPGPFSLFFFL